MSSDGNTKSPIFIWATELKSHILPPVTVEKLFLRMLYEDRAEVLDYYNGYRIPKNPVDRQRLQDRVDTLKFVATQVVVN